MSEPTVEETPEIFVKCNQGPAQIVPSGASVIPGGPTLTGQESPMRLHFQHAAMRPVFVATREACGQHKWREGEDTSIEEDRCCGNCHHGIVMPTADGLQKVD